MELVIGTRKWSTWSLRPWLAIKRTGAPFTETLITLRQENDMTTAEILPSLGRNLSGGTRTAAVPLVMPQTLREARRTQVDVRFTKYLSLAAEGRVQLNFDIYNVLNAADVLGENVTFGSSWRRPTLILNGRLVQFSGSYNF